MPIWLHGFCSKWEGWDPVNRFNHTSVVAIVTQTDRPKSVRNRCVIEVFCCVFVLSRCVLDSSVGVGTIVIGLSQISSFISMCKSDVEDEYHFMFKCPAYNNLRKRYLKPFYFQRPSFNILLTTGNFKELCYIGKFIEFDFKERKTILNPMVKIYSLLYYPISIHVCMIDLDVFKTICICF